MQGRKGTLGGVVQVGVVNIVKGIRYVVERGGAAVAVLFQRVPEYQLGGDGLLRATTFNTIVSEGWRQRNPLVFVRSPENTLEHDL